MPSDGYSATKHQREVGVGYFDLITQSDELSAIQGSTKEEQFEEIHV